jgi:ABC-type transporter MlaC component
MEAVDQQRADEMIQTNIDQNITQINTVLQSIKRDLPKMRETVDKSMEDCMNMLDNL